VIKLKSLYNYVSSLNIAPILVLAIIVKSIVFDISYATFLLTIPVLAFEGYKLYLNSQKPNPILLDAELRKELDQLKSKVNAQTFEKGLKAQAPAQRYF
jgi:hypothetical protein